MSYDSVILADNPIAYWKCDSVIPPSPLLNNDLIDTAHARNGSLLPNSYAGLIQGLPGPIITDGVSYGSSGGIGYVPNPGFPDAALTLTGAQSWECWAIGTGSGCETMINHGGDATFTYLAYGQRSTGLFADNALWILLWADNQARGLISCTLEHNVWHHVVVTYDGVSEMRMYIDSWLVTSRNDAPAAPSTPEGPAWLLGWMQNLAFGPINTTSGLSHVALYDDVLTPSQVIAHNVAALGVRAPNPCGETPTLVVSCPTITEGVVDEPYSSEILVDGGTPPYTFSVISGALPDGLTLDSVTGIVSGTPIIAGLFNFIIEVTDSEALTGISPGCGIIIDTHPPPPPDTPTVSTFRFDAGIGSEWYLVSAPSDGGNELRGKNVKTLRGTGKLTNASMTCYGYNIGNGINTDDLENGTNASTRPQSLPNSVNVAQSPRKSINVKGAVLSCLRIQGDDRGQSRRDEVHELVSEWSIQDARR